MASLKVAKGLAGALARMATFFLEYYTSYWLDASGGSKCPTVYKSNPNCVKPRTTSLVGGAASEENGVALIH